jgi:very-short-patch-repair endonuclease
MEVFNIFNYRYRRKKLRNNATEFEVILWSRLRKRQCGGHRFVRQFSVGAYIVDFYCPKKRLVVELDGAQHAEVENRYYDQERTKYLNHLELKVLRFWNSEINTNLEDVLDEILSALEEITPL